MGSYGYNGLWNYAWPTNLDLGLAHTGDKYAPSRPVLPSDVKVPSDMIALGDATLVPIDWVRNQEDQYRFVCPIPTTDVTWGTNRFSHLTTGVGFLNKRRGILASWPAPRQAAARRAERIRHSGHYSVAFCDGHLEFIRYDKLYQESDAALRRWNRNHEPVK